MNSTVSIYSFVSFCHNDLLPIIEKSVTVSTNGDITFGVLGKKIEAEQLNITPAKSLEDFANNLKQFEKVYVCHGGPLVNRFSRLTNTTSVANSVGRLQHINCCLVMKEKATYCVKCRRLVNVLAMREKRKNAGAQKHLLLSPSKRKIFNKIQNEKKCLKKKVVRAKEKINELNSELNKVKKNMATFCDEKIEEQLNNMSGINESQKTLIKECFAASKIKNTKSRRYSENWLMLCLLFNIRSPGAYKYLRDSQLLPLPHPKTVRQLLSSLKSTCGFDEDFLSLLAKKCNTCHLWKNTESFCLTKLVSEKVFKLVHLICHTLDLKTMVMNLHVTKNLQTTPWFLCGNHWVQTFPRQLEFSRVMLKVS